LVPPHPDGCPGLQPVVLRRAQHLTITLLGQSPQVGAAWFANGRSTPLTVRPVGGPPTAVWFLKLPLTSGKLVAMSRECSARVRHSSTPVPAP
jgi:hypothetical protein